MWYVITAIVFYAAGLATMYIYKKKVDAQVERTKSNAREVLK